MNLRLTKIPVIKAIPKELNFLTLLLFITANIPFLKVGPVSLSFFIGVLILVLASMHGYIVVNKVYKPLIYFTILSVLALIFSPVVISETSLFVMLQVVYWFLLAALFWNIGHQISYKSISLIVISIEILFVAIFLQLGEINPYLSENLSSFIIVTLWPFSIFYTNKSVWKALAALLAVVSLFFIGSRTGIIVVFLQFATIYIVRHMSGIRKVTLIVSVLIFAFLISVQPVRSTIAKAIEPASPDIAFLIENPDLVFMMDKSWAQRRIQQEKCKQAFERNPVIGIGPLNIISYNFTINTSNLTDIDGSVLKFEMRNSEKRSAHNAYYQLIAENGAIGALLMALFLLYLLRGLYNRSLLSDSHLIFFISLVGMVLNLFMVSALWGTNTWLLFGMYASVINSSPKVIENIKYSNNSKIN